MKQIQKRPYPATLLGDLPATGGRPLQNVFPMKDAEPTDTMSCEDCGDGLSVRRGYKIKTAGADAFYCKGCAGGRMGGRDVVCSGCGYNICCCQRIVWKACWD